MLEIRTHGRGGQGAVIASEILAAAFFKEGKHVQSFPTFGVERRGAPVAAFTRVDEAPIRLRCEVYEPDHVMVLGETLVESVDVTSGLKDGGWILINTELQPSEFDFPKKYRVATVDASGIAVKHGLGTVTSPIVNTSILGAFCRVTGAVDIKSIAESIREYIPAKWEDNVKAAQEALEKVTMGEK
jgi:2-oxoacid:acceptor oxidoreductase gamma subunit (pyruvate/2-ketoisovalerate family)